MAAVPRTSSGLAAEPREGAAACALTVIVVSYNSAPLLPVMFDSLRRAAAGLDIHCVVIDNASRDRSADEIERLHPAADLIRNALNVGFGRANNQALSRLKGKYVLLLNPDAVLPPDALLKSIAFMDAHPDCGILGAKLIDENGALQPSRRYFPTPLGLFVQRTGLQRLFRGVRIMDDLASPFDVATECDWVPGCFYMMRRQLVEKIGLFDPRYFLYYEEVDLCRRAKRAGWKVMVYPDVVVRHVGGESAKSEGKLSDVGRQIPALQVESELLYFRKNHGLFAVCAHAVLTTLAAAIVAAKDLLKRRSLRFLATRWRELTLLWSTFWRTAAGARATR